MTNKDNLKAGLWFWNVSGSIGKGHVTYASGRLAKEGPFTNPARMIEDIMGHDPDPTSLGWRSESDFWANVWRLAGWWDKQVLEG